MDGQVLVVAAVVAGKAAVVVVVDIAALSRVDGRVDMDLVSSINSGDLVRLVALLGTAAEDGDHKVAGHSQVISSREAGHRYDPVIC